MRVLVAVWVAAFLGAAMFAWAGTGSDLRPEWSVGQDLVSSEQLAVTPPIPAPASLTLREAVDLALARNTGFRGQINSLLSAGEGLEVARRQWDLSLTGSGTQSQGADLLTAAGAGLTWSLLTGAGFSVSSELSRLGSEESSDTLSATLRQPLLAGWGHASGAYESVRAARNAYRSALLDYFNNRQDLIVSITRAYFGVVQQREALRIQKEGVALAQETVRDHQIRYDEGMIIEIELLNARQQLANVQAAEVQAEQSYQQAVDTFMLQLGLEVGGSPDLVSEVDYRPEDLDLKAATEQALRSRPELYLAQLSIEDSEAGVRLARSRRLPSLDLIGGLQRFLSGSADNAWNVGLAATVPLGALDLQQHYRQSQRALLLSRQRLEDTRQQILVDIRSQVRAADAARRQVGLAEQGAQIAERALTQARRLVEEGLGTNRNLLDAQNSLRASKLELVNSKTDYFLALIRLKVAMGLDVSAALPQEAPPAETGATPAAVAAPAPAAAKSEG